jgi:hypothetical protein
LHLLRHCCCVQTYFGSSSLTSLSGYADVCSARLKNGDVTLHDEVLLLLLLPSNSWTHEWLLDEYTDSRGHKEAAFTLIKYPKLQ